MVSHAPRFQAYCTRCQTLVRTPESLSIEDFRRAVALRRSGHTLEAVTALVSTRSIDLGEAKSLVFHITISPGKCHRCQKALAVGSETCPTCHCVVFDFTEAKEPESNILTQFTPTI